MKSLSIITVVAAVFVQAQYVQAWCPFCDAPSLTLAEQVDQSAHLILGEWIGGEKPTNESAGTSRFRILEVAKSKGNVFAPGKEIELPQYIAGRKDGVYILMGPEDKLIDWHAPSEASESSWKYISNVPAPETEETKQVERLAYFLDFLQDTEITVANDAYAEFAAAPYEVIVPLKDRMPREKLQKWVMDPETPVTRLGLYGLLLGLCGNSDDAAAMKQKILYPDSDFRLGIEGVMTGYLLIKGAEGLDVLEASKMKSRNYVNQDGKTVKLPFSETYATMQTLRFMWTYEPDRVSKDRLKQSMRILLERPELADLVIADLARWKDWGVQERLMEMFEDEKFNIPSVKRAIVRYLYYCSQDKEKDAETLPEHATAAEQRLVILEEKDPKTVRNAKRFLIR